MSVSPVTTIYSTENQTDDTQPLVQGITNANDDDIILNDIWSFYFHDPYNEDWTYTSYLKITDVTSVNEFWKLQAIMNDRIHCGMFFMMREYVFPCWDDDNNKDGGCLSIKVLKQDMAVFWEKLCISLLGETLLKEEHRDKWNLVNGISTSPKKYFCIIKIWLKSLDVANVQMFNLPDKYHGEILYRSNRENIDNDHVKHAASHHQGDTASSKTSMVTLTTIR